MDERIIALFCVCEEAVKCFGLVEDTQCKMSNAEVITFALLSAAHYQGNYRLARLVSISCRYFQKILSPSRLVRRIHNIPEIIWWMIFKAFQIYLKKTDSQYFIVDSLPIKAYENHKSFRARIFKGKNYHGYIASKKQYFFGIKIHMIIDESGIPIEFCFSPGSMSDIAGLKELPCELPAESVLFGDRAYTSYNFEDDLLEMTGITLISKRKSNSRRQHSRSLEYILSNSRNFIETVFSSIVSRMPRCVRARTEKGFYLKVFFFIIAYLLCLSFPTD